MTRFAQAFGRGGAVSQDSVACTKPALDGLRQRQRGITTRQQMNAKGIPDCEQSGMPFRISNNIRRPLGCTRSIIRTQAGRSALPLCGRRGRCPDRASSREPQSSSRSNSTNANQFCLDIILYRIRGAFDYLIYPYYPAYMSECYHFCYRH